MRMNRRKFVGGLMTSVPALSLVRAEAVAETHTEQMKDGNCVVAFLSAGRELLAAGVGKLEINPNGWVVRDTTMTVDTTGVVAICRVSRGNMPLIQEPVREAGRGGGEGVFLSSRWVHIGDRIDIDRLNVRVFT